MMLLVSLVALGGLTSCNFYGGIDKPSGDTQILSAARACLDAGNYSCANTYYTQLSTSDNDIKQSETAFGDMEQAGVGFQQFAAAFGNGQNINVGSALTTLANSIIPLGPGATLRTRIYTDFSNSNSMTSGSSLQALVRFLASTTFAAEILAEMATAQGNTNLLKTDIASVPTSCTGGTCAGPGPIDLVNGGDLADGAASLTAEAGVTTNINVTTATLDMLLCAIQDMNTSLTTLGQAGSLGTSFSTLISALKGTGGLGDNAVRAALINQGVGN
jgi:hypothetical protein